MLRLYSQQKNLDPRTGRAPMFLRWLPATPNSLRQKWTKRRRRWA